MPTTVPSVAIRSATGYRIAPLPPANTAGNLHRLGAARGVGFRGSLSEFLRDGFDFGDARTAPATAPSVARAVPAASGPNLILFAIFSLEARLAAVRAEARLEALPTGLRSDEHRAATGAPFDAARSSTTATPARADLPPPIERPIRASAGSILQVWALLAEIERVERWLEEQRTPSELRREEDPSAGVLTGQ